MPATVEDLAIQAIELVQTDRARLVDVLLASLPDEDDAQVDAAWSAEIERRLNGLESGTSRLVSASDVHAQARKLYMP